MATKPKTGIRTPAEYIDPFISPFDDVFAVDLDDWIDANAADNKLFLHAASPSDYPIFNSGTGNVVWGNFTINTSRSGGVLSVNSGSVAIPDGQCLYVDAPTRPFAGQTVVPAVIAIPQLGRDRIVLGVRRGNNFYRFVWGAGGLAAIGSSTDNAVVRWNGTGGDSLQDSPNTTLSDVGILTTKGVEVEYADMDNSVANPSHKEGRTFYDNTNKALSYYNEEADVALNMCREDVIRVYNDTGGVLANGKVVYINDAVAGAPKVELADAREFDKSRIIGMVTHDIEDGTYGYVTHFGDVNDLDTSGKSLGDLCYLDPANPGDCTTTRPTDGNFPVIVGVVTIVHASTGRMLILPNISQYTAETIQITGWADIQQYTVAFVDLTRTLTLTPTASEFRWYEGGVKYTKATDSIVISDTEGLHAIYYNAGTLVDLANPTQSQMETIIRTYPTVAYVYWDQTNQECIYLGFEPHTIGMPSMTHSYLHFTRGAQYISGSAATNVVADASGNVDTHAQFGVDSGVCADEDVPFFPISVASTVGLPIYYLSGPEGSPVVRKTTNAGFSIDTAGTGRMAYNYLTGGNWTVAEVANGDCALCHVFAINDAVAGRRTIAFMGQGDYGNVTLAREGALTEISSLILGGLVSPEMVPLYTFIFETRNSYSNSVKSRVRTTDAGDDYIDWRQTPPGVGGGTAAVSPVFSDAEFTIFDDADPTKTMMFQASGITTGTQRIFTAPDRDGVIAPTLDEAYDNEASGTKTVVADDGTVLFETHTVYDLEVDISGNNNPSVNGSPTYYGFKVTNGADSVQIVKEGTDEISFFAAVYDFSVAASDDIILSATDTISWSGINASLSGAGALAIASDFTLTGGGTIASTSNGHILAAPHGTGNFGIGSITPSYDFSIGSADGSNQIGIYHDNSNVYFKTDDGFFRFITDEGTNTSTYIQVYGKGTGVGYLNVYDEDDLERLETACSLGVGYIRTAGTSPAELSLQHTAHSDVLCFGTAADGETRELKIYGYYSGDARRSLEIGVGIDAADTASFDGVSNYMFDGVIYTPDGGLSTNWVTNSLSMGHDSSTHTSWIQSGDTGGTELKINEQGGWVLFGNGSFGSITNSNGHIGCTRLECNSVAWFDSGIITGNNQSIQSFGGAANYGAFYPRITAQTNNAPILATGAIGNYILFCENADISFNWSLAAQTTPTLAICGATQDTTHIGLLAHDDTDFTIDSLTLTTKFKSGLKHNVTTVNAATYDLLASDYYVHVTYTGTGAVTSLTLPSAQVVSGRTIYIKDAGGNASTNNITVDTEGSETIDGSATLVMSTDYQAIQLYSDGSNWFVAN